MKFTHFIISFINPSFIGMNKSLVIQHLSIYKCVKIIGHVIVEMLFNKDGENH